MRVGIIDYGMGNLASVASALTEVGASPCFISSPHEIEECDRLILPGVGSFRQAMENLQEGGWVPAIRNAAASGMPILGVCLGMHLLASRGTEHGDTEGLNLIPGTIVHFKKIMNDADILIPHVGWNDIDIKQIDNPVFAQAKNHTDYYFVHSYVFVADDPAHIAAITIYGDHFTSIVVHKNIVGMQFHPEKSGPAGFLLLKNFVEMPSC